MKPHFEKRQAESNPLVDGVAACVKTPLRALRKITGRSKRSRYVFEREAYDPASDPSARTLIQIRNVLNYTKTSGSSYSAKKFPAGYHTIELGGEVWNGQRQPAQRLEKVPYDFTGKTVLDIGCNQGGMLFQLDGVVDWAMGIDYDSRMINAANRIDSIRNNRELHFYVFNLEADPLDLILDLMPRPKVDIVFLLSVCMWIKNWREVIDFSASISSAMLFETNGSDLQQDEQIAHLESIYQRVTVINEASDDDPGQKRRKLLFCE